MFTGPEDTYRTARFATLWEICEIDIIALRNGNTLITTFAISIKAYVVDVQKNSLLREIHDVEPIGTENCNSSLEENNIMCVWEGKFFI